jgi:hypothetical protein
MSISHHSFLFYTQIFLRDRQHSHRYAPATANSFPTHTARAPSSHAVPTEAPSPHTTPPGAPSPRAAPLGAPLRRAARMRPPRARAQGRQECGKLSPLPHELQPLKAPARGRQGCRELRPWPPPSELRPAVGPRSPAQVSSKLTSTPTHSLMARGRR